MILNKLTSHWHAPFAPPSRPLSTCVAISLSHRLATSCPVMAMVLSHFVLPCPVAVPHPADPTLLRWASAPSQRLKISLMGIITNANAARMSVLKDRYCNLDLLHQLL